MAFTRAVGILACLIAVVLWSQLNPQVRATTQQVAEAPSAPIAIADVTVIDVVSGAHRPDITVLVRNERIEELASKVSLPYGATQLDGKGKFLIPGLWDMHSHHQGTGADSLDLFVANGMSELVIWVETLISF